LTLAAVAAVLAASCDGAPIQPQPRDAPGGAQATPSAGSPTISQITPTASPVGTAVTITGSGFAAQGNTVKFGRGYIRNVASADEMTLQFTVPDGLDLCAPDATTPCPQAYPKVTSGDYVVAVITGGKTSNSATFTVTQRE
jgi:hypothetical protein